MNIHPFFFLVYWGMSPKRCPDGSCTLATLEDHSLEIVSWYVPTPGILHSPFKAPDLLAIPGTLSGVYVVGTLAHKPEKL
jgi:hypothetical protein